MAQARRKSGLSAVGDVEWGAHLCCFYESDQDLLDMLVPYFRAGLEGGERCLWIVCEPVTVDAAKRALRRDVPDADRHLASRAIEIVPYDCWYLRAGAFEARRVLDGWSQALADALAHGYAGLRISANEAWLTEETWADFTAYENALNETIVGRRMIVLCTYPLAGSTGARVFDVTRAHERAIARRGGAWEVIEILELAVARAAIEQQKAELEQRVADRTRALAATNEELKRQMRERERAEAALRLSEEQLRQSQKMEAIGRLAGGIAHDFNGLLTVITGYGALLQDELQRGDPLRNSVDEIMAASDRAATLTRQLLAFSRNQIVHPRVLDLNAVIRAMETMLRRIIGEDIVFRTALDPTLDRMRADAGQIEQVLMNLVVNARDAMPRGGVLTIETRNARSGSLEVADGERPVCLRVSDTGTGMDERTRGRVFEPFFTTKEVGKGTGLGLSTVYGVVTQSGGTIRVESAVGRGSTFTMRFPRVDEATHAAPSAAPPTPAPAGSETVLVAEDDPTLRTLIRRVLRRRGYETLDAADGAEAIRLCEHHSGPIHLLLTDVVMPGMSGRVLTERLARLRPDLKVLFMSGYTDDAIVRHGVLDSDIPFLHKPFTPETLARRIREVLDAPQRALV